MATETFKASDYTLYELRQSEIDPTKVLSVEVGIKCPRCGKQWPLLEHGRSQTCVSLRGGCGLVMTRHGDELRCTI